MDILSILAGSIGSYYVATTLFLAFVFITAEVSTI